MTFFSTSSTDLLRVALGETLPVDCSYMENGNISIICDDRTVFLSPSGTVVKQIPFDASTLAYFSFSKNKTALVCRENILGTENRILVLDAGGAVLCDESRFGRISAVEASSGETAAYISFASHVEQLSLRTSTEISYTRRLHAVREIAGEAVFCFSDGAESMDRETDSPAVGAD